MHEGKVGTGFKVGSHTDNDARYEDLKSSSCRWARHLRKIVEFRVRLFCRNSVGAWNIEDRRLSHRRLRRTEDDHHRNKTDEKPYTTDYLDPEAAF